MVAGRFHFEASSHGMAANPNSATMRVCVNPVASLAFGWEWWTAEQAMTDYKDPKSGKFLPGNKFWMAGNPGRPPIFSNGDDLRAAAIEYFNWSHENPLLADNVSFFQGVATHEPIAKMRAMTIDGLTMHLGIGKRTWRLWRDTRPELAEAIEWIETAIFRQKFEGAAAEMLNPSIIARDLGMVDKKQFGNDPDNPMPVSQVTIFALPDNGRD